MDLKTMIKHSIWIALLSGMLMTVLILIFWKLDTSRSGHGIPVQDFPSASSLNAEEDPVLAEKESIPAVENSEPAGSMADAGSTEAELLASAVHEPLPVSYIIKEVPALSQFPQYYNGCELISLTMLLNFKGWDYSAAELERWLPRDPAPLVTASNGTILQWGDPSIGFVGDITGKQMGYSINHEPILDMLAGLLGEEAGRVVNLTGTDEQRLTEAIAAGNPVMVWTTIQFRPTAQWLTWISAQGKEIAATFQVHSALLVGYDETHFYVNNPYTGGAYEKVPKEPFLESWVQMGRQALTIQ